MKQFKATAKERLQKLEDYQKAIVYDLNNAVFPYMLQPWAVEELQKDSEKFIILFCWL